MTTTGNAPRLTLGSEDAVYNQTANDQTLPDHFTFLSAAEQSFDAKLFDIWMTVFAVFGGTAALAWMVLYATALVKVKLRKFFETPEPSPSSFDWMKVAKVALYAVAYHLTVVAVWYAIPDSSWASAGLPHVAVRSARLIVRAEIAISMMVGAFVLALKLLSD
ncbi:hypothetical protein CERZMDRAFT_87908 [Cercospora zeae-maydis SCOH1-5]|uniref:Uncharacterized protein n=1 Tax=Cercospora zeae-maydis SCOH1-5 TaxID=717836 RepID=A0A6A6F364_9PEZI|nr:hypothetical protein CERZMDRAFT_87908 [Cercospora zeae-maydis SCOH1-5]